MKKNLIEYIQYHGEGPSAILNSPFSLDNVGFDLESEYSQSPSNAVYSVCPAWKHKSNRIYTVRSPVDLHIYIDTKQKYIKCPNISQEEFNAYFSPTFDKNGLWCSPERTTLQLTIPRFLIWTKQKNIWLEQKPHPLSSLNNNLVCVGGWFNLSNWVRPISFAFDVVDTDKPVIIKRGDPISQLSFYSSNFDDGFIVRKAEPPEEILRKASRTSGVIDRFHGNIPQSIKNNLFKNKESKCPFHFLWK